MDTKLKISSVLCVATLLTMTGCSTFNKKVDPNKPSALPKIVQAKQLTPVFATSVSSTKQNDPLRLQMASANGKFFTVDPKGSVTAYQNNKKVWQTQTTKKHGLSAGVVAGEDTLIVGNQKGELFGLDQQTGQIKWTSQLSGPIITPSHIQSGRVITVTNDNNVYAHDVVTGQQLWTYRLPVSNLSVRGQAAPVQLDPNHVLVVAPNAYVYAIDVVTGVSRLQRRVSSPEGYNEVQRLNDVVGDPVMMGQFLVTTSYQGQLAVTDLAEQKVVWQKDVSSSQRAEVTQNAVYVTTTEGKIIAYDLLNGQQLWENTQLLHRNLSNPVMLGSNLVVGDFEGALSLLDPNTGNLIGRSKTKGDITSLRVIDGQLYVSTQKGALSVWQNR